MNVMKWLVILLLGITGVFDLKYRKINILLLIPFVVAGIIYHIVYGASSIVSILGGIIIGATVAVVGVITKEKIGIADGLLLMVTGLYLGFFDNLFLFLTATLLAGTIGIILLIVKKVNKYYEMPFIPFLFVAWIGDLLLWS